MAWILALAAPAAAQSSAVGMTVATLEWEHQPVERTVERMWPGVPIVPVMTVGATDGRFLNNAGIPTYGMSGMFSMLGETNAHGLNEKIRVQSLFDGRDFLEAIVREYARQ